MRLLRVYLYCQHNPTENAYYRWNGCQEVQGHAARSCGGGTARAELCHWKTNPYMTSSAIFGYFQESRELTTPAGPNASGLKHLLTIINTNSEVQLQITHKTHYHLWVREASSCINSRGPPARVGEKKSKVSAQRWHGVSSPPSLRAEHTFPVLPPPQLLAWCPGRRLLLNGVGTDKHEESTMKRQDAKSSSFRSRGRAISA